MANARVLIVDDEPDLRELLELELRQIGGLDLTTVGDGAQAFALISSSEPESPYDVVLSDISMPKMSGLQLLKETRARGIDVPFVFLTGYGDREMTIQALRLGAFDFLDKPYASEHLKSVVLGAIQAGQALRQINADVEALLTKAAVLPEDAARFRAARKSLLVLAWQGRFGNSLRKVG